MKLCWVGMLVVLVVVVGSRGVISSILPECGFYPQLFHALPLIRRGRFAFFPSIA